MVNKRSYLEEVLEALDQRCPGNRFVNLVCHGHSVPAGCFTPPFLNTFCAYPHQLHRLIKERFPFANVNVIVTAIGGENSAQGALRFSEDVLNHNPEVITIDYGLNDRSIGLKAAECAWKQMIEMALEQNKKIILLTPSWDISYFEKSEQWEALVQHAQQIRSLADTYQVGLADSFGAFQSYVDMPDKLTDLLSHGNHPTELGHRMIALEIGRYFPAK